MAETGYIFVAISIIPIGRSTQHSQRSHFKPEIIILVPWTRTPLGTILSSIIVITDQRSIVIYPLVHLNTISLDLCALYARLNLYYKVIAIT